jgi:hypothetical protein
MESVGKILWSIVKGVCAIALTVVVCVKIYQTPLDLKVDFPTFLSLVLALFSVGLATLFYFKATETSNTFYDNTYKFTKDIAQLLTKMESGFGERLKHLDEGYASMRSSLESNHPRPNDTAVEKTKQKLDEERTELNRVLEQRNKIVRDLIERSQLQSSEKEKFAEALKKKEAELTEMQTGMAKLNKQLFMERLHRRQLMNGDTEKSSGMDIFSRTHVINKIGSEEVAKLPHTIIVRRFNRLADDLPRPYLDDMESRGYYEDGLTLRGARYLKQLASDADQ